MDAASNSADDMRQQPTRPPEKQRLHASFQDDRRYLSQMVALDANARSERVDAILELKSSISASSARLQAQNATLHRRAQELSDSERRASGELLSQGQNPHEVARKSRVALVAATERQAIEARIQSKQVDLLARLEVEKVQQQRRDKLERDQQVFEKKYQREMGRSAAEERTKQFLVTRTGKEQLDPTGKLVRVYPSQETTTKDRSFGLGRNLVHDTKQRGAIIDKVHAKRAHRDAAANPMLLPRQSAGESGAAGGGSSNNNAADRDTPSPSAAAAARALVGPTLPIPGRDLSEVNHRLLPASSSELLPPIQSSGSARTPSEPDAATKGKKGFGKPKRSVLEQQMLVQAREKQKCNVFTKQVVWGKEFTGDAFLSDPPVLWFKDFDVGEPLTLTFTLTNVSNTFNHFKLVEIQDETLRECFEVVYEKPGRMSAGMACTIRMSFTALAAVDVDTVLPAMAQTGRFEIPVRCTCKKAVPVLLQREVRFKDVVAGEKKAMSVTLENRGALPLHFRVKRTDTAPNDSTGCGPEVDDSMDEVDASLSLQHNGDNSGEGFQALATGSEVVAGGERRVSAVSGSVDVSSGNPNDASEAGVTRDRRGSSMPELVDGDAETHSNEEDQFPGAFVSEVSDSHHSPPPSFSAEESSILAFAKAFTVYNPEGAETPLRHTKSGLVAPYSSTSVSFTFTPATPMTIVNQLFALEFAQENNSSSVKATMMQLPPSSVMVSAEASHVPIFTAEQVLHLGCCVYGKLYRHQIVVCNRGKVALKIQVRVPKALDGVVEFTPNMGYVQAAVAASLQSSSSSLSPSSLPSSAVDDSVGRFVVQIKFRPQPGMWKSLERKGFGSEALGFIAVPVQVLVPDQVVPVFFLLVARLTSSTLAFSMDRVDFGVCPLGHSVFHRLTLESSSRLPQHIGFLRLPQEVKVDDPSDGVGVTLLPFEKKTLTLVYQPVTATSLRAKLCMRTSLNQEYFVPCTGSCLATPLVFSHTCVRLGATQLGQSQSFSLLCSNVSEKAQSLELLPPDGAHKFLRLTPLVSRIEPNSSVRIEVVFSPTEDIFELAESGFPSASTAEATELPPQPPTAIEEEIQHQEVAADSSGTAAAAAHGTNSAAGVAVNRSSTSPVPALPSSVTSLTKSGGAGVDAPPPWEAGILSEERSVHHKWTVLCFRRGGDSSKPSAAPLLSIHVETTTIEPKVFSTPATLDYSQVAIGQSLVMELTLTNSSRTDASLSAKPLHVLGGFRMVNSLRPIRSGATHTIKMEFKPQSPIVYEDELELSSPSIGNLKIPLRGEGINPSLSFAPADGWLDFKDVLARNRAVHELVLSNASSFPLTYSVVLWPESSEPVVTSSGLPVFTFTPSEAMIPAQGSLVVKVTFSPVLQRPEHYRQRFRIKVPNESEKHLLTLSGRCWEDQLFVFAPALLDLSPSAPDPRDAVPALPEAAATPPPSVVADPFDLPPGVNLSLLSSSSGATAAAPLLLSAGLRKTQQTLTLAFNDSEGDSSSSNHSPSGGHALAHQLVVGSTLPPSDDETHIASASQTGGKAPSAGASAAAGSGAAAGSFELAIVENAAHPEYAKLFTIEPMKSALSAGQQVHVHVTYIPPVQSSASSSTTADESVNTALREKQKELVVSQWIEVQVVCTLRGGFLWRQLPVAGGSGQPPAAAQKSGGAASELGDVRTVLVTLRAKMTM